METGREKNLMENSLFACLYIFIYIIFLLCFVEFIWEGTFLPQMGKNETRQSTKYVKNI
jgi:hypothetical protein